MTKKMNRLCPHCDQYKLEPRWGRMVLFGIWLVFIGLPLCLLLIGFIFIPIGILMIVLGRLCLKGYRCVNCGWNSTEVQ